MVNDGILTVAMPGVGHMFSEKQVKELVALVAGPDTGGGEVQSTAGPVSFSGGCAPDLSGSLHHVPWLIHDLRRLGWQHV